MFIYNLIPKGGQYLDPDCILFTTKAIILQGKKKSDNFYYSVSAQCDSHISKRSSLNGARDFWFSYRNMISLKQVRLRSKLQRVSLCPHLLSSSYWLMCAARLS